MKDRIAGAPGQYSAVVPSSEYQKLQSGQPFTITLTRDDNPEVEGTPYSKAAVLPDDVAKRLCPDIEDPTPADAFDALEKTKAPAIESTDRPGCYYRVVNGVTEWINPPMSYRVEYRTTERYNGKVVYAQLLSIGALSNEDFTKVDNIAEEVDRIFYTDLIIKDGNIGAINPTGHRISFDYRNNIASVSIFPDGQDLYGGKSAYLYVKYTKV